MSRIGGWIGATAAVLLGTGASALADPLLWAVRDPDSTVYVFGTVHTLRPNTPWRTAAVADALGRSQSLWLETERDEAGNGDLIARLGFAPDRPLSLRLEDTALEATANVSLALGLDFTRLETMRPWLATATIGAAAVRRDGFTAPGVDLVLASEAAVHGVDVAGFDPQDTPVRLFASLPAEAETALLASVVTDLANGVDSHVALVEAWLTGDPAEIERIGLDPLRAADPRLYDRLIVARNRTWLPRIEHLMLGAGTHFVAVGTLHTVGPDSVIALLTDRGYTVSQID